MDRLHLLFSSSHSTLGSRVWVYTGQQLVLMAMGGVMQDRIAVDEAHCVSQWGEPPICLVDT